MCNKLILINIFFYSQVHRICYIFFHYFDLFSLFILLILIIFLCDMILLYKKLS
uniref:Uncharacterized protein n=1 Tax=Laurencieae sp. TaxID=2007162 RepID=A0A1Z1M2M0_9FLOR|nr:hypothetical protein [Laurencieae sp.]